MVRSAHHSHVFSVLFRIWSVVAVLMVLPSVCSAYAPPPATPPFFGGPIGGGFNNPVSLVVDASGNVYVADQINNAVKKIPAGCRDSGCVITLPGTFGDPSGVAVDSSGNVYVADTGDSKVKEIQAGCASEADGCVRELGDPSVFYSALYGIAVDGSGNVYFSEGFAGEVYEMSPNCVTSGCTTALGGGSFPFSSPYGLAVDGNGNVYVADVGVSKVYEMTPNCFSTSCITELGGGFGLPTAVAVDAAGRVYVADDTNSQVDEMPPGCSSSSCVSTVTSAYISPWGVAVDINGNVYVADDFVNQVAEVARAAVNFGSVAVNTSTPVTQTVAFTFTADGTTISTPVVSTQGADLDFTDAGTGTCTATTYNTGNSCTVDITFVPRYPGVRSGAVVLYDNGSPAHVLATGYLYGAGTGPQVVFSPGTQTNLGTGFQVTRAIAVDAGGNTYIASALVTGVFKIAPGGAQSSIGTGFATPAGLAVDGAGGVLVVDGPGLYRVSPDGTQVTVSAGSGYKGVAVDGGNNIYVAAGATVFEIKTDGTKVSIGSGWVNATGVAVDGAGYVYVSEQNDGNEYKVAPDGTKTVIGSGFVDPGGVAVDAAGNVYVADTSLAGGLVAEITAGGNQTTIGHFQGASGVAVDGSGNLFVSVSTDSDTGAVKVDRTDAPSFTFPTPTLVGQVDTTDGQQTVTVTNLGNATLTFPIPFTGLNPSTSLDFSLDSSGGTDCPVVAFDAGLGATLDGGASCDLRISFTPQEGGAIAGAVVLTDDSLNAPSSSYATQTIGLNGTANNVFLTIASGNPQSTTVFTAFASPLVVLVTDGSSNPVAGMTVTFTAGVGGFGQSGTFSNNNDTIVGITGADGTLSEAFTANVVSGDYTVSAQIGTAGPSVQFNLTNTPDVASQIVVIPELPGPLFIAFAGWPIFTDVFILDQYYNPVTNFPDTLRVTSSDGSALLPPDSILPSGAGVFGAILNTSGNQTFTVTDITSSPNISGTTDPILVIAPPSLVVNTTDDDEFPDESHCSPPPDSPTGACTLRDALNYASSFEAGNITFDPAVFKPTNLPLQNTILLNYGVLDIPDHTTITGQYTGIANDVVTVSGNNLSPVFEIGVVTCGCGVQASITGIAITGGMINDPSPGALQGGAAIFNEGTLTVSHSVISGNSITTTADDSEIDGGAIFSDNDLEISNSIISGNTATSGGIVYGGGVFSSSYVNADTVTVSGNTATSPAAGGLGYAEGGGIDTSDADIANSTISGNSATATAADNSGLSTGGGIAAWGIVHVTNSTVAGNSATSVGGGGVAGGLYDGDVVRLKNVTISANTSDDGGGVFNDFSTLRIANSIVADNTAPLSADFDDQGTTIDNGGNFVSVSGMMLGALGNYGGPTQTMLPLPGSAAICGGLLTNLPFGVTKDQRGFANTNVSYPGYTSGPACVDSGAVQTAYMLAFTIDPPPSVITGTVISPNPVVGLTENGVLSGAAATVTMSDSASALSPSGTNQETLSSGMATFDNLIFGSDASNDTLTATTPLTASITLTVSSSIEVTSITPVAPTFTWSPASTIIYGDAGASVLNASVSCTSCGSISYKATKSGGGATVTITSTAGLVVGTYTIEADFTPSSSAFLATSTTRQLTVSDESVWIVNSGGGLAELAGNGDPISTSADPGANLAVAIDGGGGVWTIGSGTDLLDGTSRIGTLLHAVTGGGGLKGPSGIAIDGNSHLWITNAGNNSISLFLNDGTPSSPSSGYTDNSLSTPSGVAVDLGGSVWISNQGNNSLTRVLGAGTPVAPLSTAVANKTTGGRP